MVTVYTQELVRLSFHIRVPCKQRFLLSCMAFSVYEVLLVAAVTRVLWFVLYAPGDGIVFLSIWNLRHYLYSNVLAIWRMLNGKHKRLGAEVFPWRITPTTLLTIDANDFLNAIYTEGVNGVNRLATNGKKHYRLPIKREKNYRLPTGKLLTDYRHGPTLSIFFSERRVYCIFSTFLGSNQRYHVTSLFTNIPQNEDIEIGLQSVCQKFLQPA